MDAIKIGKHVEYLLRYRPAALKRIIGVSAIPVPRAPVGSSRDRFFAAHDSDLMDCRVEIITEGKTFWRSPRADGSYCSSNDPRILVGLGEIPDVQKVIVHWPDGAIEEWSEVQVDQYNELHRGTGRELDGV